ncbi:MAG: GNAT family N-acetyltransferase [Candidatus Odinarchaeota archaeon]
MIRTDQDMNSEAGNNGESQYLFRSIKEKERMTFYEHAFDSTREFAEKEKGVNFAFMKRFCQFNRLMLGLPFKILARNVKDIVLTFDGKEIIAGFTIFYDKKKDEYNMGNFFTRPEYQGRGIGNLVLRKVIDDYGDKKISLVVDERNEVALHLYRKFGFQEKSSVHEFAFNIPLNTRDFPAGYSARIAVKEDLTKLDRLMKEIPDMENLAKQFKKSLNKTEKKKFRVQNFLAGVLIRDGEIVGIGDAYWTKMTPETADIMVNAVLPDAKEAYPSFISFLTREAGKHGIKRAEWGKTEKTEVFFEEMKPFLPGPIRTGYKMEFQSDEKRKVELNHQEKNNNPSS